MSQQGLIVFDLDGTLSDTRKDLAQAVNITRAELHLPPLPLEVVISYVGNGADTLMKRSLSDYPDYDLVAIRERFRENYFAHLFDFTELYPYVYEGIQSLHTMGYTLALHSNKPQLACEQLMNHFQLSPFLTEIIGGGGRFPLKPDPTALQYLMKKTKVEPQRTWMVGDHYTDIVSANNVGIESIFALWGFGETKGYHPTFLLENFKQVVEFFTKKLDCP